YILVAIRIIRECIAEDDSNNRLDKSARNAIKLGELLSKTSETDEALKCFDRAFKVFASLSNHSMDANKALERKAQLLIEMENFLEAAKCYSDLYHRFSQNNVLKFSASAMLLKAFLAKLCIDDVDAKIYFEMQSTDRDINKSTFLLDKFYRF
ncbi:MAG: hypothetical protein MHPSP_002399, partial [Paramarteilia canceri]